MFLYFYVSAICSKYSQGEVSYNILKITYSSIINFYWMKRRLQQVLGVTVSKFISG